MVSTVWLARNGRFWRLAFNTKTEKLQQESTIILFVLQFSHTVNQTLDSAGLGWAGNREYNKHGENWR